MLIEKKRNGFALSTIFMVHTISMYAAGCTF